MPSASLLCSLRTELGWQPISTTSHGAMTRAVARIITTFTTTPVNLPSQHAFWGVCDEATVVAIPFVRDAVPMRRLHRTPDGTPYVDFDRKRVTVINEKDLAGHMALAL